MIVGFFLVGVFQEVYTKEEDQQARMVARNMLQDITREVQGVVIGNTDCLSGAVIKTQDSLTKLMGLFYIESDKSQWTNGQYRLYLDLKVK